ncbi:autotransporter outer membrane beta-barrel domain-containing protein, partial [Methylobacterium crusticola]|uniref:autotransporter outer membrane beta-barrel domain-containing protein n=1 Tax=Methylobacterium crusticola TaxID=1697972 RepID=UPI000FFB9E2B
MSLSPGSGFTNAASGILNASAASLFGGGSFSNAGTVALGAGASLNALSTFDNAGTVRVAPGATAAIGAGAFTNSGVVTLQNGQAGDRLLINGNYVGRNGQVSLDVASGSGLADSLSISGSATGTTRLNLLNLTPGAAFTTSPVLIQVAGQRDANA